MHRRAKVQKLVIQMNNEFWAYYIATLFFWPGMLFTWSLKVSHCFCTAWYFIFAIRNGCSFCTVFTHFLIHADFETGYILLNSKQCRAKLF